MKKKSSENDQSTGHFRVFFLLFFCPATLNLKKKKRKSTNKEILPLCLKSQALKLNRLVLNFINPCHAE